MSSGEDTIVVYQNMWNSFSINASAGGLVTCSIGYMSLNKFKPQISTENITFTDGNYFEKSLVAYW